MSRNWSRAVEKQFPWIFQKGFKKQCQGISGSSKSFFQFVFQRIFMVYKGLIKKYTKELVQGTLGAFSIDL